MKYHPQLHFILTFDKEIEVWETGDETHRKGGIY